MEQLVQYESKLRGSASVDMEKYIEQGRFGDVSSFAADNASVVLFDQADSKGSDGSEGYNS